MFKETDSIISDPLRFKIKLAIGEDAYASLRLKNRAYEAWDALGVAGTAAMVVSSSFVASTFFAPSGFLALIGFGTAVTPIGWVVSAAVISGGAWAGVSRYIKKQTNNKVTTIPAFINTPMDVLALALFDLMAPLALKVSKVKGHLDEAEKHYISGYFIKEWGYNESFVSDAIALSEDNLDNFNIEDIAYRLIEFQKGNPDCNYAEMSAEIISFLTQVMEADGIIDKREQLAIAKIESIFKEAGKHKISKSIKEKATKGVGIVKGALKNKTRFKK